MRPRHAFTGVVAAVGGVALLWCAWLVLRANLTTGTTVAVVALWLLAAGAVATLAAYVREVERHRADRARHRSSAKPLPGLVLLWVAGLTALAAFPFMLSGSSAAGATSADPDPAPAGAVDTPAGTTTSTPVPSRTSPTSPSRGATRTPSPSSTSTSAAARTTPRPVTTSTTAATTHPSSSTTTAPRPTTSTTTSGPIVTITLPPVRTKGH